MTMIKAISARNQNFVILRLEIPMSGNIRYSKESYRKTDGLR